MPRRKSLAGVFGLLLSSWAGATGGLAGDFNYSDFSAPTNLIFQADAVLVGNRARVTPAMGSKVGGVWYREKQLVKEGFDTRFQVQVTEQGGHGADGMAFVVQNNPTPSLGARGSNLGFGGIANSLVVKLDNYHWHHDYVKYDEIAVVTSGRGLNYDSGTNSIGSVTNGIVFSDGKVHTVRIAYVPGNLRIFLHDLENPVMTVFINLAKVLELDQGRAWVGLTAATGADFQNHDVLNWSFKSAASAGDPNRVPSLSAAPGPPAVQQASAPTQTSVATEANLRVQQVLPSVVALTHQVEASTNLVDWTPVTNLTFYFADPDSTNFNYRFYRFREK